MCDSALSQTTISQFDLSTPNGMNYFGQKRHSGKVEVFTFHWKQDARKDEEWYKNESSKLDSVIVAQEIDINYHASVEGLFIPPEHVKAAVELDLPGGTVSAGLDVAAGGKNNSALAIKTGCRVSIETKDYKNGTDVVHWAIDRCNEAGVSYLNYDKIGVGHAVYSGFESTERKINFKTFSVNAGATASDIFYPEFGKKGSDMFFNAVAEWWYIAAKAFKKTYEYVNGSKQHDLSELISIPNNGNLIAQLSSPKKLVTEKGEIKRESKEQMRSRGIQSPDEADGLVMSVIPQSAGEKYLWSDGARIKTQKLDIEWTKNDGRNALHYGAMVQHRNMEIYILLALWDNVLGKLFVYDA